MPGPRQINYTVDCHVRYNWRGQKCENVFQFRYTPPLTLVMAQALANSQITSDQLSKWSACHSADSLFTEVFVRDLNVVSGGLQATSYPVGPVIGTRAQANQSGSSLSVTLRSGFTGRTKHGRKSIGPVPDVDVSQDDVSSAFGIAALAWLGTLLGAAVPSGFSWAIGSATTHLATNVTAAVLTDTLLDSMKTRLKGHGR